ncbi:hypothetical protein [Nonomuraea jabiensis]|uniref:hypothetical protein n=1 Tax=Nonomuraea jabiensis TaxID=882448 RepID=UPI0036A7BB0A
MTGRERTVAAAMRAKRLRARRQAAFAQVLGLARAMRPTSVSSAAPAARRTPA